MRHLVLASLGLAVIGGAAWADTGKGDYSPLKAETVLLTAGAEVADPAPIPATVDEIPDIRLLVATVADVDLNGDGFISFDELLRFDVKKDF